MKNICDKHKKENFKKPNPKTTIFKNCYLRIFINTLGVNFFIAVYENGKFVKETTTRLNDRKQHKLTNGSSTQRETPDQEAGFSWSLKKWVLQFRENEIRIKLQNI